MVAQAKLQADAATISAHLHHITRRWQSDFKLEIVFLSADDRAVVKDVSHYALTALDRAVEHIAAMNNHSLNAYVTGNPIKPDAQIKAGSRAKAEHIACAYFHWADADTEEAANNIRNFMAVKSTFTVLTGATPHARPHVYWELEEPTYNLDAWTATQRAIAATLATDSAVVDPPRIMRIAGTVNWPKPQKKTKGYIPEVTQLHIHDPGERPPISSERMARVFSAPQPSTAPAIATNVEQGKSASHYADIIRRAKTDGEKHTGVRDMTAALAGMGVSKAAAEAIVREICPVWDDNAEDLLRGAYEKFYQKSEAQIEQIQAGLRIQTGAEFDAERKPPVYLIDGILQQGFAYSATGYAGHGKTTLLLHMCMCVATGQPYGGCDVEQGSFLFIAGENPDNVRFQWAAALAAEGLRATDVPSYFLGQHFQMAAMEDQLHDAIAQIPNLRLIVVDSLQSFFEGESDNSNVEMIQMAQRMRRLTTAPTNPAVITIAHPAGKTPDKSMLTPRGGSAFTNELDGNYEIWKEKDGTQSHHHSPKFRGTPFDPLPFVIELKTFDHLRDHKGREMALPVSRQQMLIEQSNAARKRDTMDKQALEIFSQYPQTGERPLSEQLNVTRYTAREIIEGLKREKLITRRKKGWHLTQDGKDLLDE